MKKKTKTVIGVILAVALVAVLVVVGFMTYLGITWTNNHEFGEYVSKEGPWGMTATWVSEDSSSYLICKKENDEPFAKVTAYFQGVDGWQAYELHGRDRIAYLNTVENDTTIDSTSGNMKFDGTTFTITDLDKEMNLIMLSLIRSSAPIKVPELFRYGGNITDGKAETVYAITLRTPESRETK